MCNGINIISLLSKPERKLLWFMYAIIGIYISLPFVKCMVDKMGKDEDKLFVILWLIFNGILSYIYILIAFLNSSFLLVSWEFRGLHRNV